jgi:hypothetical protein
MELLPRRFMGLCLLLCAVALGCRAPVASKASAGSSAQVDDAKNDERITSLEQRVAALERGEADRAKQMRCLEAQRRMKSAWYEHDRAALAAASGACNPRGNICSSTGLPTGTIGRYRLTITQIVAVSDAPFDLVRAKLEELPKLPNPPVQSALNAALRATRDAAESATEAFFTACKPAESAAQ